MACDSTFQQEIIRRKKTACEFFRQNHHIFVMRCTFINSDSLRYIYSSILQCKYTCVFIFVKVFSLLRTRCPIHAILIITLGVIGSTALKCNSHWNISLIFIEAEKRHVQWNIRPNYAPMPASACLAAKTVHRTEIIVVLTLLKSSVHHTRIFIEWCVPYLDSNSRRHFGSFGCGLLNAQQKTETK